MKYLCLIYANEQNLHLHPQSPTDDECWAYAVEGAKRGQVLAGEALQSVETATLIRPQGAEVIITDGPFADTKEQLVGFYMIEARDLNEAIQFARDIPAARVGCVEVRPVRQLETTDHNHPAT